MKLKVRCEILRNQGGISRNPQKIPAITGVSDDNLFLTAIHPETKLDTSRIFIGHETVDEGQFCLIRRTVIGIIGVVPEADTPGFLQGETTIIGKTGRKEAILVLDIDLKDRRRILVGGPQEAKGVGPHTRIDTQERSE